MAALLQSRLQCAKHARTGEEAEVMSRRAFDIKEDVEKLSSLCLGASEPEMESVGFESGCLGWNPCPAAH